MASLPVLLVVVVGLCLASHAAAAAQAASEALTFKTFKSPPISLRSGQIANTLGNWGPLDWVKGPIAIRHFDGKIVDDSGKFVPLTEVYVHHWILFREDPASGLAFPNGGVCSNLVNIFGIGAELWKV